MASHRRLRVQRPVVPAAVEVGAGRSGRVLGRPICKCPAIAAECTFESGCGQTCGLDQLSGAEVDRSQLIPNPEDQLIGRLVEAAALRGSEQAKEGRLQRIGHVEDLEHRWRDGRRVQSKRMRGGDRPPAAELRRELLIGGRRRHGGDDWRDRRDRWPRRSIRGRRRGACTGPVGAGREGAERNQGHSRDLHQITNEVPTSSVTSRDGRARADRLGRPRCMCRTCPRTTHAPPRP